MVKIAQTEEELNTHLNEQLVLLSELVKLYDIGNAAMAKPMATVVRVLLHDTSVSKSLLGQLSLKDVDFYNTAEVRHTDQPGSQRVGSFSALIGVAFGGNESGYVPYLDNIAAESIRHVKFDEYWNEIIFEDQMKNTFTRADIVKFLANQDGGSHVGSGLDVRYQELSRRNSLGWKAGNDIEWIDIKGAELASMRQIAHEILRTFVDDYVAPVPKDPDLGVVVGGGGFILHFAEESSEPTIRRQGLCSCGSGKKYKRCHGAKPKP